MAAGDPASAAPAAAPPAFSARHLATRSRRSRICAHREACARGGGACSSQESRLKHPWRLTRPAGRKHERVRDGQDNRHLSLALSSLAPTHSLPPSPLPPSPPAPPPLSLSLSPSRPRALAPSRPRALSPSRSLALSRSPSLPLFPLSLSLSRTLALSLFCACVHFLACALSVSPCPATPLSQSRSLCLLGWRHPSTAGLCPLALTPSPLSTLPGVHHTHALPFPEPQQRYTPAPPAHLSRSFCRAWPVYRRPSCCPASRRVCLCPATGSCGGPYHAFRVNGYDSCGGPGDPSICSGVCRCAVSVTATCFVDDPFCHPAFGHHGRAYGPDHPHRPCSGPRPPPLRPAAAPTAARARMTLPPFSPAAPAPSPAGPPSSPRPSSPRRPSWAPRRRWAPRPVARSTPRALPSPCSLSPAPPSITLLDSGCSCSSQFVALGCSWTL